MKNQHPLWRLKRRPCHRVAVAIGYNMAECQVSAIGLSRSYLLQLEAPPSTTPTLASPIYDESLIPLQPKPNSTSFYSVLAKGNSKSRTCCVFIQFLTSHQVFFFALVVDTTEFNSMNTFYTVSIKVGLDYVEALWNFGACELSRTPRDLCGTFVVPLWNTCGTFLGPLWNLCGTFVGP